MKDPKNGINHNLQELESESATELTTLEHEAAAEQPTPTAEQLLEHLKTTISNLEDFSLRRYIKRILTPPTTEQEENPELKTIMDNLSAEGNDCNEDQIIEIMRRFSNHPSLRKPDGTPRESLASNSAFTQYIIGMRNKYTLDLNAADLEAERRRFNVEDMTFKSFFINILATLYEASLSQYSEKREGFFLEYPPEGEDLLCMGGNGSRGENVLQKLRSNGESILFLDANISALSQITSTIERYINQGNVIHAPRYLEYILSLKPEQEVKKSDENYLTPQADIPSKILLEAYQTYSTKVKNYLINYLNEEDIKNSIRLELKEFYRSALADQVLSKKVFEESFAIKEEAEDENNSELVNYEIFAEVTEKLRVKFSLQEHEIEDMQLFICEDGDSRDRDFYRFDPEGEKVEKGGKGRKGKKGVIDTILHSRLEKIAVALRDISCKSELLETGAAEAAPAAQQITPVIAFSKLGGEIIAAKLNSNNPQELLEGLEALLALGSKVSSNAIEHFCEIIRHHNILQNDDAIEVKIRDLLPEHAWKFAKIRERFGVLERDIASYHNSIATTGVDLFLRFNIASTEEIIELINTLSASQIGEENALCHVLSKREDSSSHFNTSWTYKKICISIGLRGDAPQILGALTKHSADVPLEFWRDMLINAALEDNVEIVRIILQSANAREIAEMPDSNGNTALHIATYWNRNEIADAFLQNRNAREAATLRNAAGHTALYIATANRNTAMVNAFLQSENVKEFIGASDRDRNTALHIAAINGSFAMVTAFLQNENTRKIATLRNAAGHTALHIAASRGDTSIVSAFLESENAEEIAEATDDKGHTALYIAAFRGHAEIVNAFLQSKNAKEIATASNVIGNTALHIAASRGNTSIVAAFLESKNAEEILMLENNSGHTAFHLAASKGHAQTVRAFLQNGATLRSYSPFASSSSEAELAALQGGHRALAQYLAEIKRKQSALHKTIKQNPTTINAAWLDSLSGSAEDLSCIINSKSKKGENALHRAINKLCSADVISALIDKGANVKIKNAAGLNVIDLALEAKNYNALTVFVERENSGYPIKQVIAYLADHSELKSLVKLQRNLSEESKLKLSAELLQWFEKEKSNLDIGAFKTIAEISQIFKGGAEDSTANIEAPSSRITSRFSLFRRANPQERSSSEATSASSMTKEELELKKGELASKIVDNLRSPLPNASDRPGSSTTPDDAARLLRGERQIPF